MEKAALYIRLSDADAPTQEGAVSESVRNQEALLFRYAQEHHFEVWQVYVDEDWSGADPNRPAFRRLIADAEARRFDLILVKSLSRFSRDMEQAERYLHRKFPEWGVRLVAVADGSDTADPSGQKARQLSGLVNQWYLEDLSANVRAALSAKRRQGKYLSAFALYGYRKAAADRNRLVPDPDAAPVVRRIFALCLAGYGAARIALVLNAEGVASPSAYKRSRDARYKAPPHAQWSSAAVLKLLHNPIYTGDMVQGRYQKAGRAKGAAVPQPRESWTVAAATHEPLVSRETFALAQRLLAQRRAQTQPRPVWRPLARKVRCGGCGGGMMVAGSRDDWQMRCLHNRRDPRLCCPNRIPTAELEAVVLGRLKQHLKDMLEPDGLARCVLQNGGAQAKARRDLRAAQREKRELAQALGALYLRRADGSLPLPEFSARAGELTQRREALDARAAQLLQKAAPPPLDQARQKLLPLLRPDRLTRELSDALIDHVTVWPAPPDGAGPSRRKIGIAWKF